MGFNKKGDRGYTSLLYGHRVPKHNPRTDAYGVLDEANSALGLARAAAKSRKVKEIILSLQKDLFVIGSELATLPADYHRLDEKMTEEKCQRLEDLIEEFEGKVKLPNVFTIPGDSLASAALDLAGRAFLGRAFLGRAFLERAFLATTGVLLFYLFLFAGPRILAGPAESQAEKYRTAPGDCQAPVK